MKRFFVALLLIISIAAPTFAYSKPANVSVSDYCGILSDSSKNYIKSKNDVLFSQTEAKIIFVVVPSTGGLTIEEYCNNLYSQWEISSIGRNNSIFFVVDAKKKEYDFIIGNNISLALTDIQVYDFILNKFEPCFETKEYEKAFLGLYNALGKWYENHYNALNLNLDENLDKYTSGKTTADKEKPKSNLWIWITLGVCVALLITVYKIKHKVELRIRRHEREKLRRKYKIDIDKIVNS
ncbi:MAG: TPM domain-containing protein [Clostridia bacterium]|nr:TPM domain-containing protein [Clostridia bacterium]